MININIKTIAILIFVFLFNETVSAQTSTRLWEDRQINQLH